MIYFLIYTITVAFYYPFMLQTVRESTAEVTPGVEKGLSIFLASVWPVLYALALLVLFIFKPFVALTQHRG